MEEKCSFLGNPERGGLKGLASDNLWLFLKEKTLSEIGETRKPSFPTEGRKSAGEKKKSDTIKQ